MTAREPVGDSSAPESELEQLTAGDHAVLSLRQLGEPSLSIDRGILGPCDGP
ncbi:MAG: hypothetical protein WKF31_00565 [Thermoleophilaceae bacterium]